MTDRGRHACFTTLGIAPTGDVRAIKRAYAGVLKTIDLATDPDRFARLRTDYEAALDLAPTIRPAETAPPEAISSVVPDSAPASDAVPEPVAEPEPVAVAGRWDLRAVSPRLQWRNPPKNLDAVDNHAGWITMPPGARMPMVVQPMRRDGGGAFATSDDGEAEAFAALLDETTPDRPALLDAGLRRYGWDMIGSDLGGFGRYQGWLAQLLEERARWGRVPDKLRYKHQAQLVRLAAAPPSGSVGDLTRWRTFEPTAKAFPLWTAFVVGSSRLDQWAAARQNAPVWKRWLAWLREHPALLVVLVWISSTVLFANVSDRLPPAAAAGFMVAFGLFQMTLVALMAVVFGRMVIRSIGGKS